MMSRQTAISATLFQTCVSSQKRIHHEVGNTFDLTFVVETSGCLLNAHSMSPFLAESHLGGRGMHL